MLVVNVKSASGKTIYKFVSWWAFSYVVVEPQVPDVLILQMPKSAFRTSFMNVPRASAGAQSSHQDKRPAHASTSHVDSK